MGKKNIASINLLYPDKDFETIADKIKQFSCTKEVITGHCCLLPKSSGFHKASKLGWERRWYEKHRYAEFVEL